MADDETLWRVLDHARLKDHVKSMVSLTLSCCDCSHRANEQEGGLDAHVDEGGSNLSSGQRYVLLIRTSTSLTVNPVN